MRPRGAILQKTLRVVMENDVTGLDPAATQDVYSYAVEGRIFDALYVWDYLARPYRLVPSVAAAMPEISADGRTWKIRLRCRHCALTTISKKTSSCE